MHQFNARLEGITLSSYGHAAAKISCKPEDIPSPGQAVMACKPGNHQPLRELLFPIRILPDGFVADSPPAPDWRIGDTLNLWGPLGKGFTPPPESQKWLLASFENPPHRLFPLIEMGLKRGVAISLSSDYVPPDLPPQVEWIQEISEALGWADYLAVDLPAESVPSLRSRLGISPDEKFPITAQILPTQPIPCGLGVCYACAVKGHRSTLLACIDGPVFESDQLEF
jgi:hypothetical protein